MSLEEQRRQMYLRFVVEAKDNGGPFENPQLNKGWQIWNAALDSVEIKLPAERIIRHLPRVDENQAYNEAIENCREAIEAAGVKVKA